MSEFFSADGMRRATYQHIEQLSCIQKLNRLIKDTANAGGKEIIINTEEHPEFLLSHNPELQKLSYLYQTDNDNHDFNLIQGKVMIMIYYYYRHLGFHAGERYAKSDHNFVFSISWFN